jgi:hypothetical protein
MKWEGSRVEFEVELFLLLEKSICQKYPFMLKLQFYSVLCLLAFLNTIDCCAQSFYSPDTTFGIDEYLPISCIDFGGDEIYHNTTLKSDGNLLIQSTSYNTENTSLSRITFAEFLSNGIVNENFGQNGQLIIPDTLTDEGWLYEARNFIKYDENFGIFIFLDDIDPTSIYSSGSRVIKYTTDGHPDSQFGTNGAVNFQLTNTVMRAISGTPTLDGGAISLCISWNVEDNNSDDQFILIKYDAFGVPDQTFGTNGFLYEYMNPNFGAPQNIISLQNGNFLLCTISFDIENNQYIHKLFMLSANGSIISDWGVDGHLEFSLGENYSNNINYFLDESNETLFVQLRMNNPDPILGSNAIWKVNFLEGTLNNEFNGDGLYTLFGDELEYQFVAANIDQSGKFHSLVFNQGEYDMYNFADDGTVSMDSVPAFLFAVNFEDSLYYIAGSLTSFDFDESGCVYGSTSYHGIISPNSNTTMFDVCAIKFCLNSEPLLEQESYLLDFDCYPNPVANLLTLQSVADLNEIYIYNSIGELVDVIRLQSSKSVQLDLSSYIPGAYFLVSRLGSAKKIIVH